MVIAVSLPYSPEDKAYRKCNTKVGSYMPFPFIYGMSREETREKINELFPSVHINWAEKDVDSIVIPQSLSLQYDMAWFGFKKNRLSILWYSRRVDDIPNPKEEHIERWIRNWYSVFEARSGYVNTMPFNVWDAKERKWFSINGDSITFLFDSGPKEQYHCLSALSLN
jgi:hypothetical protein